MIKRPTKIVYLAFCWVPVLFLVACGDDGVEAETDLYSLQVPDHFPEPTYTLENNPITKEGFELGRKLFFDPLLSRDKSVSCNNCHQQARAFADTPAHPTSIGVENRMGIRNAPSLANMAFLPEFFWDGGVTHLDFVPINAIESPVEMDDKLANVVDKLNSHSEYPSLFNDAFGIEEITSPFMLHALSQFTLLMVSADSPYDQYVQGEQDVLDADAIEGMAIFENKCGSCHNGALFTDFSYRNNGLNSEFSDLGRATITENDADIGKFRVPSLRNATLTSPYMHNARFTTLREVLDHYDGGMIGSENLDPVFLQNGEVVGIPLEEDEKLKILAFMETLTDQQFISNPIFRNHD